MKHKNTKKYRVVLNRVCYFSLADLHIWWLRVKLKSDPILRKFKVLSDYRVCPLSDLQLAPELNNKSVEKIVTRRLTMSQGQQLAVGRQLGRRFLAWWMPFSFYIKHALNLATVNNRGDKIKHLIWTAAVILLDVSRWTAKLKQL